MSAFCAFTSGSLGCKVDFNLNRSQSKVNVDILIVESKIGSLILAGHHVFKFYFKMELLVHQESVISYDLSLFGLLALRDQKVSGRKADTLRNGQSN